MKKVILALIMLMLVSVSVNALRGGAGLYLSGLSTEDPTADCQGHYISVNANNTANITITNATIEDDIGNANRIFLVEGDGSGCVADGVLQVANISQPDKFATFIANESNKFSPGSYFCLLLGREINSTKVYITYDRNYQTSPSPGFPYQDGYTSTTSYAVDTSGSDCTFQSFAYGTDPVINFMFHDFLFSEEPAPPPPDNIPFVNVSYPINNTVISDNATQPFIFQYGHFAPNICYLYEDVDGIWDIKGNISSDAYNVSTFVNITESVLNLSDKYALYKFDEGSGSTALDLISENNGTIVGALYEDSKLTNGTGNYSLNFTNDYVSIPFSSYMDFGTSQDFSISAWVQADVLDSNYHLILDTRDVASDGVFLAIATGNVFQISIDTVSMTSSTTLSDNDWHFIVASIDRDNAGNTDIWIDGVAEGVGVTSSSANVDTSSTAYIGRRSFSAGVYWEGRLDEVTVWNKSLTNTEIQNLYHNGLYYDNLTTIENITTVQGNFTPFTNLTIFYTQSKEEVTDTYKVGCVNVTSEFNVNSTDINIVWAFDFTPPSISFVFPDPDNATWNFDMFVNLTTDEGANCTVNNTAFSLHDTNTTYHSFFENTLFNDFYSINVSCEDDSLNNNTATSVITFTKDEEEPFFEILTPLNNTLIPNVTITQFVWNLTDNNDLYSVRYNFTYNAPFIGEQLLYSEFINLSGFGTQYVLLRNIDTSNFTGAVFSTMKLCDSHTNNNIKDAKVVKDKNKIKFTMDDNTVIEIEDFEGKAKKSKTDKLKDRYSFGFTYNPYDNTVKKFKLKSTLPIDYIEKSIYPGHFVIGDYWVDFDSGDSVTVDQECLEGVCEWVISVDSEKEDLTFNSIGELNCNVKHFQFNFGAEEEVSVLGLSFDPNNVAHVFLIFSLIILYIGCMLMGFFFKNFGFASFGFIIGVLLGLFLASIHIYMFLLFTLINISIFIRYIVLMK